MLVDLVGRADLDVLKPGGGEGGAEFVFGEGSGAAAGSGGHVGFGLLVDVAVGDHL